VRRLEGRVAIVTGAGRGLGRAHAVFLASQGAKVIVNDLGVDVHGERTGPTPARQVVEEIRALGGEAEVSVHDVADWTEAAEMIQLAVDAFGDLHVLVNNAGILRDRTLFNMTEAEWDAVIRVHLKGHAAPTRHAVSYWRSRVKAGHMVNASVIHTSSVAAFAGNIGQANYAAAKLALLGLSRVVTLEAGRLGVRSNVISPSAVTRLSLSASGPTEATTASHRAHGFDPDDPENVSPLIAWLAAANCPATSQVFHIDANRILVISMPQILHTLTTKGRWTVESLERELPNLLARPVELDDFARKEGG